MAPSNAQKKALAKAKRGIVASGAMSAKGGFDPQMHKSREMACPHCERIFKQQDRLKQHIARQHADAVEEKSESESSAVKSKSGASYATNLTQELRISPQHLHKPNVSHLII